jgi:hypothetical protein
VPVGLPGNKTVLNIKIGVYSYIKTVVLYKEKVPLLSHKQLTFFTQTMAGFVSSPLTGLEWPRGFQEDKVPRFNDNGTGWW